MFGGAEGDEKHPKSAPLTLLPNSHLTLHLDYADGLTYSSELGGEKYIIIELYEDIYTSPEKSNDKYAIPEKISYYSISGGVFSYNGSNKFKVEIVSNDEIILHSYITNKKYTLYREDNEYVESLLNGDNEW